MCSTCTHPSPSPLGVAPRCGSSPNCPLEGPPQSPPLQLEEPSSHSPSPPPSPPQLPPICLGSFVAMLWEGEAQVAVGEGPRAQGEDQGKTPWVDKACAGFLVLLMLLMPGSRTSSRSLGVCPCTSICFITSPSKSLDLLPRLPCHQCKNRTQSTSFCGTKRHMPRGPPNRHLGSDQHLLQEGEGAPEQGPQPLRAPGVFLEFLEPRLEAPRASIRAP